MISLNVIGQLRVLKRANVKATKFDKDIWAAELGPVLNLWRKLNQVNVVFCNILNPSLLIDSPDLFTDAHWLKAERSNKLLYFFFSHGFCPCRLCYNI